MPATSRSGEDRRPPLGQRAGRLALEVEQDPPGLGPHDLAQVVVAVHPLRRDRLVELGQRWSTRRRSCRRTGPVRARPRWPGRAARNICSARSRSASGASSSVPNASARSRCTSAVAAPSRCASPAKSPPAPAALASSAAAGLGAPAAGERRRSPWGTGRWCTESFVYRLLAYRSRTLVAASVQPSVAVRRYSDRIASVVVTPSMSVSIEPYGSATCGDPSRDSAEVTSRSGFGPGETRRNTFRIDCSPNTRLVLLCSAVSTMLSSSVSIRRRARGRRSGTRWSRWLAMRAQQVAGQLRIVQRVVDVPAVVGRGRCGACSSQSGSSERSPIRTW